MSSKKGPSPGVIPPRSIVRAIRTYSTVREGQRFRIGYYSRQDGLDVVWLVNDDGAYEQTWPRRQFEDDFTIERLSTETDYYGDERPPLDAIPRKV